LGSDAFGVPQFGPEDLLKRTVTPDLTFNVADGTSKPGLEPFQLLAGALELFGMGITLMLDQGLLGDPHIGLAKRQAMDPGHPDQAHARLVDEFGIGGPGDVLFCNRGIDNHPGEV